MFDHTCILVLMQSIMQSACCLVKFHGSLNFLGRFSKNIQIQDLMKIRTVGAKLFHKDGRTDRET